MTSRPRRWVWLAVAVLLLSQAVLSLVMVHRESLTFDEDDHMFAGYMMWKAADYGLNPEHPPLVKLLATIPVLGKPLWIPPRHGWEFKKEAYLDGRDWLARNDGGRQRLVFRMRASAELLALGLCLVVFLAARSWFGETAGLVALVLVVFDPNVLAHSALVTTDVGVSLFFLASVYMFYRYVLRPSMQRLLLSGLTLGLLLATKHSAILVAPMLLLLVGWEILAAPAGKRREVALRLTGAVATMSVLAVLVLWCFYGFRFAARPAGLQLSTTLAQYAAPLQPFQRDVVLTVARWHLLPESYLLGLVDVKRVAEFYPTFLLGRVYPHGVWWYFPMVILIKTTLGLLALVLLGLAAVAAKKLRASRELVYVLVPPAVYLLVAMVSGMNIGARHLLPMYAFLFVFAGAALAALPRMSKGWALAGVALVLFHVASSMCAYPVEMAYANEAWGGSGHTYRLLSDANVDWAQQLIQVRHWQDQHPNENCYFAYFANPEVQPSTYGIHCRLLPTLDTEWLGGDDITPPVIDGTVLVSAGDWSGCEWPTTRVNPYRDFQTRTPDEVIDRAVFVYRGHFELPDAASDARAQHSAELLGEGQVAPALAMAREAATIAPENVYAETALGNAAAAAGDVLTARQSWGKALAVAKTFEPGAQPSYVPSLTAKLAQQNGSPR